MRVSVIEAVSVVVFSLAFSSSGIKTYSWLSTVDVTPDFYVAGGIFSMLICSLLLIAFASLRAWRRVR
jgi:hypothetical protein